MIAGIMDIESQILPMSSLVIPDHETSHPNGGNVHLVSKEERTSAESVVGVDVERPEEVDLDSDEEKTTSLSDATL